MNSFLIVGAFRIVACRHQGKVMTSVSLPSTSGPIHQVFSSVSQEITNSESEFDSQTSHKRCLSTPSSYSCKKRRKQSTPIRISAPESPSPPVAQEGKQTDDLQCSVCQQSFDYLDHLQNHIVTAHQVKQEEPPLMYDPYGSMKFPRQEFQMMNDFQNKDWMARLSGSGVNSMFMLPTFQNEGIQRQPIKIFNPDAYCELCNKEFCNKYFLKTHKANKHGIYTDTPSEQQPFPNTVSSLVRLPTTVPSDHLKTESQTSTISDIFQNPFTNKPSLSQLNKGTTDEKESNPENLNSTGSSSGTEVLNGESCSPKTETESTSYKSDQDGLYYVPNSNMSPGQIGFNKDLEVNRLRKIGVMNPKAFCEICCKEYCNKYFLRTHKLKRHGIMIPDENKSDIQPFWNQIQTSPLNLIKSDQTSSERKTTSPDISCNICEIKFQNASLAQLHNISVHSKLYAKETESEEKLQEPTEKNCETISEDLKKLQTMILQLNDLKVEKMPVNCNSCNKEFESRYFLHAHMITDHGILMEERMDNSSTNNIMCDLCGKDAENLEQLKKHLIDCHSNLEQNMKEDPRLSTSNIQMTDRRIPVSSTPTSSYCEICNKELCNKYFMKTHMQRMHGIEIENGAQIGGVVCDICNKELCSKYFLRVHKHNTHGIVEYGTNLLPAKKEGENASQESDPVKPDLADLSQRYFTHFTEVCKICSRRFRSTKWLKAHLMNDHGQTETDQQSQSLGQHSRSVKTESPTLKIPNSGQDPSKGLQNVLSLFGGDDIGPKIYQCGLCSFTTSLLPLLFVHERSHGQVMESRADFKCPVCSQIFYQSELLQHHIFKHHPLLPVQEESREDSKSPESKGEDLTDPSKLKLKKKKKWRRLELSSDVEQSLSDISKVSQLPVSYALPNKSSEDEQSKFVMQPFLMEDEGTDRNVCPAVVFLPVLQKQQIPVSITFTLTPA